MNAPEHTESQTQSIEIEYEFPQAPEKVWRVLSDPELLAQWLLPNNIDLEVGQRFQFEKSGNAIECEVLEVEPLRRLSYSWRDSEQGETVDSVVTFEITATPDGGTHLRLIHSGLPQRAVQAVNAVRLTNVVPLRRKTREITACMGAQLQWAA
jgi:uncharacterized protein YndB with AHSA1/START domain